MLSFIRAVLMMPRELIGVKELSQQWGVSQTLVRNLIRRSVDPLPAFALGAVRIDPVEAEKWLVRQKYVGKD